MKAVTKILAGGIGLAALAGAAPAAAQYYPTPSPYGGYGYGNQGGLGAIIEAIIGTQRYGNGYGYDRNRDRYLIDQCARATEARLQRSYGGYANYGGYGSPYGGAYANNGYSQARIVNISRIERRSNGGIKIYGNATSGRASAYGGYGSPYGGAYGSPYGGAYGSPYGGGYGSPYGGYGQPYGYNTAVVADVRFDCSVDYRGRVTDVDLSRRR